MNQDQQLREALHEVLDAYNNKDAALVFDWDKWAEKAEKALTDTQQAAPSQGAGEFQKTQLMLEAEDAGFVTLEGYVHSLKTKLAAALLEASTQREQHTNFDEWFTTTDGNPSFQDCFAAGLSAQREQPAAPVDMVLHCPKCGTQHIDAPEVPKNEPSPYTEENGIRTPVLPPPEVMPSWTNPPHKSHLCHGCGHIWRPSDTPTNGVACCASGKDADTAPAASKPEPQAQAGEPEVVALDGDDPVVAKFDNEAVDRFAFAMKSKMAKQRAKGYYGWADERTCQTERLQSMLADHIGKGDPVDVGNFAMMLFNRKERTTLPVNALCSGMESDSVSCAYCAEAHAVLDSDESKIIRNAKDGYPDGREPRELKLAERVSALCTYAADWKRWCLKYEEAIAKKDAVLKACVEAWDKYWQSGRTEADAVKFVLAINNARAITQGQEALK